LTDYVKYDMIDEIKLFSVSEWAESINQSINRWIKQNTLYSINMARANQRRSSDSVRRPDGRCLNTR